MNGFPYRKGVNAVVIDKDNLFLLVQKQNYGKNQWDFPGGGLENNESPQEGILRELKEELGSTDFKIIKQSPIKIKFEWPQKNIDTVFKKYGKWWRGQEKYQLIIRFTGDKNSLDLQEKEIRQITWVEYSDLERHLIFKGQWDNAKKVIEESRLISS